MIEKVDDGYGECEGCGYLGADVVREREGRARVDGEWVTVVDVQVRCGHCARTRWVRKGAGEEEDTDSAGPLSVAPGGARGGRGLWRPREAARCPLGCGGRVVVDQTRGGVRYLKCSNAPKVKGGAGCRWRDKVAA